MPPSIAVVIPCYRVDDRILDVIARIGPEAAMIFIVDDGCPQRVSDLVLNKVADLRVRVLRHETNQGVGAATLTGMRAALAEGADIVVKLDGDGQMDPEDMPRIVAPIVSGEADYAKGNRFFSLGLLQAMPLSRLVANSVLSLSAKLSSGYWGIFDPANGYIAIGAPVLRRLPLDRLSNRFFFEPDMLFQLNLIRAHVVDVPVRAKYDGERSNVRLHRVALPILWGLSRNFLKRIVYVYFVREFSVGSLCLAVGGPLLAAGLLAMFAGWNGAGTAAAATGGMTIWAALATSVGLQLLLAFLIYDIATAPRLPIHSGLALDLKEAGVAGGEKTEIRPRSAAD